jgi:predicted nucleic acid-binding Zn ribbon protein
MKKYLICQHCGCEFSAIRKDAKFCSDKCRWTATNNRRLRAAALLGALESEK